METETETRAAGRDCSDKAGAKAVAPAPCGPRAFGRGLRHRGGAVERGDSQRRVGPSPRICFLFWGFVTSHLASLCVGVIASDGRGPGDGLWAIRFRGGFEVGLGLWVDDLRNEPLRLSESLQ